MWLFHCVGSCLDFLLRLQLCSLVNFPLHFCREMISRPHKLHFLLSEGSPEAHRVGAKKTPDDFPWGVPQDLPPFKTLPVCCHCSCCQCGDTPHCQGARTGVQSCTWPWSHSQTGAHSETAGTAVKYIPPPYSRRKESGSYFGCKNVDFFMSIPIALSRETHASRKSVLLNLGK